MSTPTENTPNTPVIRKKLGEILIQANLIDQKTLENAMEIQKTQKKKIGQILMDMGVTDDEKIAKAIASQLKIPFLRLSDVYIPQEVIDLVPQEMAEKYMLLPVKVVKKQLVVAMANPLEFYALDDLQFITRMSVFVTVATQGDILSAIRKFYPIQSIDRQLGPDQKFYPIQSIDRQPGPIIEFNENVEIVGPAKKNENNFQNLLKLTELPPVVRFTNAVLADAIKMKASDVHIEPQKDNVVIRYRIDGIMREIIQINKKMHLPLVSRIKIISNMDISIHRQPQDGRAQVKVGDSRFDLRVSTLPTSYGEKVTIRILNPDAGGMGIDELGFSEKDLRHFMEAIVRPQGIILVTGPTGSGKSSTLYTALKHLNSSKVNIVTVEDPVEFDIAGINQVQINSKGGATFANVLRSILRQDPDIIMVGEIRDGETAKIAFQAAQTGHLVLSTLHSNDAPSAVIRLLDMGVDSFVIADSLLAVIGQRLVRGICKKCKIPDPLTPQIFDQLESVIHPDRTQKFWKGAGCEACHYYGYMGRRGIFELLMITPAIREILSKNVAAVTIKKTADKEGFTTLSMDGITKAFMGLTTIEEVMRVAPPVYDDAAQESLDKAVESRVHVSAPERKAQKPKPLLSNANICQKKVLVVGDDPIVCKLLQNILEYQDYLTVCADNGIEGMKIAVMEKLDLVITDYIMPEMNGMELITKLKSQLATRFIPVIMLTTKDEVGAEAEVINAGADDYLIKPIDPKLFIVRVNRLLNQSIVVDAEGGYCRLNLPVI